MSKNAKNNHKILPFRIGIIILTLLIVFPSTAIIHLKCNIPNEITVSEGSKFSYELLPFTSVSSDSRISEVSDSFTEADRNVSLNTDYIGSYSMSINLFDNIPIKNVNVNITPKKYVIPSGETIGIKMYTDGVLIVGISYVTTPDGETVYPAKEAGLKNGDIITGINGSKISSIEELTAQINKTNGTFTLSVKRDDATLEKNVTAAISSDDRGYKIGIWVRDSAAGVGTMTFYDPETNKYASLGHAITDIDTGNVLKVLSGNTLSCNIVSVTKGKIGNPGELIASFTNKNIGNIDLNCPFGVYGSVENPENVTNRDMIEVATRFQITEGDAYILADIDGNGVRKYSVQIQKISKDNSTNKGIVFKVTDNTLIEKTGGIVQGMSGAPIIQNNRLIGAVTHVFVNNPTKGYGIFAENMIDKIYSISQ